jgi:hypothetical protein
MASKEAGLPCARCMDLARPLSRRRVQIWDCGLSCAALQIGLGHGASSDRGSGARDRR